MPLLNFTVPMIPPDLNHYVRHTRQGRHYVTKEATEFKATLATFNRGEFIQGKSFAVHIVIVFGKGDRGDVDGFPKLVLDGLADCGVFRDRKGKEISDAYVDRLLVYRDREQRPPVGRTEITVGCIG
jgi:crossover junction endodeoxyribonuclease RusA